MVGARPHLRGSGPRWGEADRVWGSDDPAYLLPGLVSLAGSVAQTPVGLPPASLTVFSAGVFKGKAKAGQGKGKAKAKQS